MQQAVNVVCERIARGESQLALVSGAAVGQATPSTDVGSVQPDKGFLQGSSNYGERDDSGANK